MAIFRSSSKAQKAQDSHVPHDHKIGPGDSKFRTLEAVKELQPFEEATNQNNYARRTLYLSHESGDLKDIFGNRIEVPDVLNPTRSRNERPLDTIRGFEYAISGDVSYHDQLESHQLGWDFHRDFSHQNYQSGGTTAEGSSRDYNTPQYTYGNSQNTYQPVYTSGAGQQDEGKTKKKKKGLFRKNK